MKNDPDQNSTDSAEIEALITRIERGQLRDWDAQLLARLLRLLLRLITLLQHKNASLSHLKLLLFGSRSDKRREANSSPGAGAEGESDSASLCPIGAIQIHLDNSPGHFPILHPRRTVGRLAKITFSYCGSACGSFFGRSTWRNSGLLRGNFAPMHPTQE